MFKVNGIDISDDDFAEVFSEVKPAYDELKVDGIYVSEYEFLTVMAFLYFIKKGCEIVLLEVSMGGRMDTTNVIPAPLVSVITPISYDHMTILGNTLTEIATEKAGIIKPGTSVVSATQEPEVQKVLRDTCKSVNAPLDFVEPAQIISRDIHGQRFCVSEGLQYETTMLGTYQIDNATVAISAARKLMEKGYHITEESIRKGIANTKWFGRFTLLSDNPPVVIDGGHNRQGAKVLRESLETYFPGKKITFVLGILADKEVDLILDTLAPIMKKCYTVAVPNPRTMEPQVLAGMIQERGIEAESFDPETTIEDIKNQSDVVCLAGSLYLISLFDKA
jgi:dihydrofolate synthase/folylpolyglutamate synthase